MNATVTHTCRIPVINTHDCPIPLPRLTTYLLAAFFGKVEVNDRGCWVWRAGRSNGGYGVFRGESAHRWSFRMFAGSVHPSAQVDHLCRNTACVNPAHLDAVTPLENQKRAHAAKLVLGGVCKRGHFLTEENIVVLAKNGQGATNVRVCRECRYQSVLNAKRARRERIAAKKNRSDN